MTQDSLRAALETLDGLATAVIAMKLAIPIGRPLGPEWQAFLARTGDVNRWLDENDRVQGRAALQRADAAPEGPDAVLLGHGRGREPTPEVGVAWHETALGPDWTFDPESGRTNAGAEFQRLVDRVAYLIRSETHVLDDRVVDHLAVLLMAQLAHVEGLAPARLSREAATPEGEPSLDAAVDRLPCAACGHDKADHHPGHGCIPAGWPSGRLCICVEWRP